MMPPGQLQSKADGGMEEGERRERESDRYRKKETEKERRAGINLAGDASSSLSSAGMNQVFLPPATVAPSPLLLAFEISVNFLSLLLFPSAATAEGSRKREKPFRFPRRAKEKKKCT